MNAASSLNLAHAHPWAEAAARTAGKAHRSKAGGKLMTEKDAGPLIIWASFKQQALDRVAKKIVSPTPLGKIIQLTRRFLTHSSTNLNGRKQTEALFILVPHIDWWGWLPFTSEVKRQILKLKFHIFKLSKRVCVIFNQRANHLNMLLMRSNSAKRKAVKLGSVHRRGGKRLWAKDSTQFAVDTLMSGLSDLRSMTITFDYFISRYIPAIDRRLFLDRLQLVTSALFYEASFSLINMGPLVFPRPPTAPAAPLAPPVI